MKALAGLIASGDREGEAVLPLCYLLVAAGNSWGSLVCRHVTSVSAPSSHGLSVGSVCPFPLGEASRWVLGPPWTQDDFISGSLPDYICKGPVSKGPEWM